MAIRTGRKTVTFKGPFVLGGSDEVMPAGTYGVEADVEHLTDFGLDPAARTAERSWRTGRIVTVDAKC